MGTARRILRARWRLPLGALLLLSSGTSYSLFLSRPSSGDTSRNQPPWESGKGALRPGPQDSSTESNKPLHAGSQLDTLSGDYTVDGSGDESGTASSAL